MTKIHGHAEPRFKHLEQAMAQNFGDGFEHGAGVAVVHEGKLVAHLWAGHADRDHTRPWAEDTLVNVWSCTKGVVAVAVAMAVERGLLDYDQPLAKVWPGFADNGKQDITLGQIMSHQSGLNGFATPQPDDIFLDWPRCIAALEDMAPNFPPGSTAAYHALTYGHLAGEALRRVTGQTIGTFIRHNIAEPLQADFHLGLTGRDDTRVAAVIPGPKCNDWLADVQASPYPQACRNPAPDAAIANTRRWRAEEVPGGNGHATAAALATIYGNLAGAAQPLVSAETWAKATRVRYRGLDESFDSPTVWAAGLRLEDPEAYGPRASRLTFGHGGWGGSLGFGDPEHRLGFAYVTNHMLGFGDGVDPRRARLIAATYAAI